MEKIYIVTKAKGKIFKTGALLLFILAVLSAGAQVQIPFTQRTSVYTPTKKIYHIKGDFTMIGNTNMTLVNYCDDYQNINCQNSQQLMQIVDADSNPATSNSSSATLQLSTENGANPSCSDIIYAGLYWTGRTDLYVPDSLKRMIKIKGPGMSVYTSRMASSSDIWFPGNDNMFAAYTEVTDLVQLCGLGEYWVADMALTSGIGGNTGYYGGWGMVIIYENSLMKWRDVTLFDGYAYVAGNISAYYDLPVTGFNTTQSGPVNMKLGLIAGEGDLPITGDYFQIIDHTNTNWVTLSHGGNYTNDFFNSSIYTGGNLRNPNLANNTGMDISMFSIPNTNNSIITNNQSSTTFRYGSTQDTYIIFAIGMAVEAYVPIVEAIDMVANINGVAPVPGDTMFALPGDIIHCRVDIRNKGSEAINNTQIKVPVPFASEYVSCSRVVNYTPLPTPNNLYFDPTMGANGTIIWELGNLPLTSNPDSILATLYFDLRVTTDCGILSNTECPPKIFINGTISGTGALSNIEFTDIHFIQGFQNQVNCQGLAIYDPLMVVVDASAYLAQYCMIIPSREFVFCNIGPTIPVTQIMANFLPGSHFYSSYPVTQSTIEYDINNPFPATVGTVTYYSKPPGLAMCYFLFTITVTNITSVPLVTSPVSYCEGDVAVPLTAIPSDPSYTLYYYETPASLPQVSITPPTNVSGTFTYYVAESVSNSCISQVQVPITVNVNDLPLVTAGAVSGCAGALIPLNGQPSGGSYSVANPYTGPGTTYTYTYTDGNGCTNTSAPTTISINPLPVVTAGDVSGCINTPLALSGSPAGGTFSVANPYTGPSTTYTYTYTDNNGCTNTSAPAQITFADSIPPEITCPPDLTISCEESLLPLYTGEAYATDNCALDEISFSDVSTQSSDPQTSTYYNYIITRTWTATDVNSNSSTCIQTITVQDVTPPVIACPPDLTICWSDSVTLLTNYPQATDNCSPVTFYSDQPAEFPLGTTTVNWTATDVSGNTAACTQIISRHVDVTVNITDPATLDIMSCAYGDQTHIILGYPGTPQTIVLNSTVSGGTPGYTYLWSGTGSQYLSSLTIPNPEFNPAGQATECGSYLLFLTVTDSLGCQSTDDVLVQVVAANGGIDAACGQLGHKVLVCHGPPGNPNNMVTICISVNALGTHSFSTLHGPDPYDASHGNDCIGTCGGCGMYEKIMSTYPNPFSESITFSFTLATDDQVKVDVYDMTGNHIQNLYDGQARHDEEYRLIFNGKDRARGLYIYKMVTSAEVISGKMLLVK